jgi:hypothetical protein
MLWCVSGVTHTYTTHTPPSVTGRLQQQLATPYIFVLYNEPCTYWDAGQYTALHAPHMHMHKTQGHSSTSGRMLDAEGPRGGGGGSEEWVPTPQLHNSSAHHWKWAVRLRDLTPLMYDAMVLTLSRRSDSHTATTEGLASRPR